MEIREFEEEKRVQALTSKQIYAHSQKFPEERFQRK